MGTKPVCTTRHGEQATLRMYPARLGLRQSPGTASICLSPLTRGKGPVPVPPWGPLR
jgi:hypothetical protein